MTNPLLLQAELAQLRGIAQKLGAEREQYVRLTICLANLIRQRGTAKIVNGHVAVDLADYLAVPTTWQLALEQGNVKAADALPDDKGEDVLVVIVTPKEQPKNGLVVAERPSKILMP